MSRAFDPLDCIPCPDILRKKLTETETLADRLRILLDVSERIRSPLTADQHGGERPPSNTQPPAVAATH